MFLKHFAGKNQLPGFYKSGTLVESELMEFAEPIQIIVIVYLRRYTA